MSHEVLFQAGTILFPVELLVEMGDETVPLGHRGTEIVPLRVPYYGQSNSAPRGTVSVPFFSECTLVSHLSRVDGVQLRLPQLMVHVHWL